MSSFSSFFKYIDEYEIEDIHSNIEHIYQILTIIVCFISLLLSDFKDSSSTFLIAIVCVILISAVSFFFDRKVKSIIFKASIASVFIILLYTRLHFMDAATTNPILTLTELAISLTVIFRFGIKRSFWIPLSFVLTAFYAQHLLQKGDTFNGLINNEYTFVSFFILITIFSYVFFITATHAHKMNSLHTNLSYSNDELEIFNKDLEIELADISNSLDNLKYLSTINSHQLRAPIARIQGLLILQKSLEQDLEIESGENLNIGISIKDEIEKSYIELSKELDNFEKHLAVKKG